MRLLIGSATALVLGLFLAPAEASAARPVPCPDRLFPGGVCTTNAGAALAACCPCDSFRNHGRYVRCMAHATNALRKADCLDAEQRRSLKRCAARSTCSKPEGFVTCCRQRPGKCRDGFCEQADPTAPPIACTTSATCPLRPRCTLKRGEDKCLAANGTVGATASCCGATLDRDGACQAAPLPPP